MELINKGSIHKSVQFGPNCKKIEVGFNSRILENTYIDVPELTIGEYTTIHKSCTLHGYLPMSIGHNCWIGQNCILDSIGGLSIGHNVGIGAYSQLWSHIKFGDQLAGCRWKGEKPLTIGNDVWFVGHCIVSPITASDRSMALAGSVVTIDMVENHVYGGTPVKDLTEKTGPQFEPKTLEWKKSILEKHYESFLRANKLLETDFPIALTQSHEFASVPSHTTPFCLDSHQYRPTYGELEVSFIRSLLYDKAKFLPIK
jgi:acetyltransferase-like isoleucine patch superfamily enzyme